MPCLSMLGIVPPRNHPPSRTSMLPPHSPQLISQKSLLFYPPNQLLLPTGPEQDQTLTCLTKWLHRYLLLSPKAEIF